MGSLWWKDGRGISLVCMQGQKRDERKFRREKIELEEMARELRKMKNGKHPGVCNIQLVLLKAGGMSLVKGCKGC